MLKQALLLAAASVVAMTGANATTYTGLRTIGTDTAALSITTDGTIGVLSGSNVTAWTIDMSQGGTTFQLNTGNSQLLVNGSAFSATATDLLFDFSAASGFALFQAPSIGAGQTFYCPQVNGCFDFSGPGEAIDARNDFAFSRNSLTGVVVLASTRGAVPEPASWALMIAGFGLAGGALRRRKMAVSFA